MIRRLLTALVLVKTGNAFENLLNEIRQTYIIYIKQKKWRNKYITI